MTYRLLCHDSLHQRFIVAIYWRVGNVTKVRFWRPKNFKLENTDAQTDKH